MQIYTLVDWFAGRANGRDAIAGLLTSGVY